MTLEAFMNDDAGYQLAADLINEATIAALYACPSRPC